MTQHVDSVDVFIIGYKYRTDSGAVFIFDGKDDNGYMTWHLQSNPNITFTGNIKLCPFA